jgi:hypothetical protein
MVYSHCQIISFFSLAHTCTWYYCNLILRFITEKANDVPGDRQAVLAGVLVFRATGITCQLGQ